MYVKHFIPCNIVLLKEMYFPCFAHIFQKLHYVKLPENTNGIYYINWVLTKYQINVLMAWLIIYIKLCIWVLCNQFTLWAKIANNKLILWSKANQKMTCTTFIVICIAIVATNLWLLRKDKKMTKRYLDSKRKGCVGSRN